MMGPIDYYFGDPVHCVNPVLVPSASISSTSLWLRLIYTNLHLARVSVVSATDQ
jgi:hypothetical protein